MKRKINNFFWISVWVILILVTGNFSIWGQMFPEKSEAQEVVDDVFMDTSSYSTEIEVKGDNSYLVREDIKVFFSLKRHGIYRYIPQKGSIAQLEENGEIKEIPYYASFDDIEASKELHTTSENGNKVLRLGDPDENGQVVGEQEYRLQYKVTPVTSKGYTDAYYNIFPTGWQNEIPAGSTFKIHFPKAFDRENFQIYYGRYGERLNGMDIVNLTWDGNTVSGILKEVLPVGTGMTFYVPMEEGYFQNVATMSSRNIFLISISGVFLLILILLFWFFGRDRMMISSVQFQPPEGFDSAAVGYIIDGNVSDKDVMSLLLFWADKGYMKLQETEEQELSFIKISDLPEDAPKYEKTFFTGIFGKHAPAGKTVKMSNLKYRMANTFTKTKEQIEKNYEGKVYTKASKRARIVSVFLSCIPVFLCAFLLMKMTMTNILIFVLPIVYLIGLLIFNYTIDFWYAKAKKLRMLMGGISIAMSVTSIISLVLVYGIGMLKGKLLNFFPGLLISGILSCAGLVFTGFMKKRTEECVEWMGYLSGLREFIETAELERMEVIAQDSPHLFYHILPFAYVFGLTDILLDKMKDLALPSPDWYETQTPYTYFDYHMMHRMMHTDMDYAATTISTPKPSESSSGSGGSSGGFSGGGFGGGGGFSGGGFGGGGGGSW